MSDNFTNVGLTNHAVANFDGVDSQTVDQFKSADDNLRSLRPDARYKFADSKITIETGARVTRNHGASAPVKRFFSGLGTGFLKMIQLSKADVVVNRDLRHAGFEMDKQVNKLVEDIVNSDGKLSAQDISKKLENLDQAKKKLADKMNNAYKGLAKGGGATRLVEERIATNLKESVAAALAAKPEAAKSLFKALDKIGNQPIGGHTHDELMDQYQELMFKPTDWNGNSTKEVRKQKIASGAERSLVESQKSLRNGVAGAARSCAADLVIKKMGDGASSVAEKFISGDLGKSAPTKDSLTFLNEVVNLANRGKVSVKAADEAMKQLAQQLDGLSREEIADLFKAVGYETTKAMFKSGVLSTRMIESDLETLKQAKGGSGVSKEAIAEKQAVFDALTAAQDSVIDGIASNLSLLNEFSLVEGEHRVEGSGEPFMITANSLAPTLTDEDGYYVHTEKELEQHFDDVLGAEILDESPESPFRNSVSATSLLAGMLNRYTDGQLSGLSDTLVNTVRQSGKDDEQVFEPTVGPNVSGAAHPEMILKAMKASVGKFENPPPPNEKARALLDKVRQKFDGPDQGRGFPVNMELKGKGKNIIQSAMMLRGVTPQLGNMSQDDNETEHTQKLAHQVSKLIQAVANGVYSTVPGRLREIEQDYLNAVKQDFRDNNNGQEMHQADLAILQRDIRLVMHEIENYVTDQFSKDSAINQYSQRLSGNDPVVPSESSLNNQIHLDGKERVGDFEPLLGFMTDNANQTIDSEVKRGKHKLGDHGIGEVHGKDFSRAKFTLNGSIVTSGQAKAGQENAENPEREFDLPKWTQDNIDPQDIEKDGQHLKDLVAKKRWAEAIEQDAQMNHGDRLPMDANDLPRLTQIVNQSIFATFLIGATQPESPLPFIYSAGDGSSKLTYDFETTDEPGVYKVTASRQQNIKAVTNFRDADQGQVFCDMDQSYSKETFTAIIDLNKPENQQVTFESAKSSYKAVPGTA
ncbi:MAG: hypothetical protein AAGC81_12100 [Pseudomonadota bacterium]